ncbi:pentatricopeptide repeat-containing protein [Tanacetum coccineum]
MYGSFECVKDARTVFDGICVRDVAVWNAMVSGYCKVGEFEKARALFEAMEEKNVVSWTALIAGYAQGNKACEAVEVFRRMRVDGVKPDEVTMVAVLSACAQLGALELGEWVHQFMGNIKKAMDVFENMKDRCVITWSTVIAGLALHVLSACSHSGLVEPGRWYFSNLLPRYGIKPRIQHYGCMIDLLGQSGCISEAQELLKQMPFEPNAAIWGSLLAASRLYGNVELGENALEQLVKLKPNNSGNFSLLSNIYAAEGHWSKSGSIKKTMIDNGVKMIYGASCIQLNSRVHEFVSGNGSHPLPERISDVLSWLNRHMDLKSLTPRVKGYCVRKAHIFFDKTPVKTLREHLLLQLPCLHLDASLQGSRINHIRDKLSVFN